MSPPGSLMQNVEPSISVTGLHAPPCPGGRSPDDHGSVIELSPAACRYPGTVHMAARGRQAARSQVLSAMR
jgi:hypothetical protein